MDEDITMREDADEKLVNDAFQRLLDSYLASRHRKKVDIITKAFNFARQAHKGVRRLSGEPVRGRRRFCRFRDRLRAGGVGSDP